MKKKIAATLALLLVLSGVAVSSPSALKVDTVSAATAEEGSTTAPATTTTKPTTTKPATTKTTKPAATTTKTTVVKATGSVYVVKKGDNLWNIARKNGLTLVQLLNLNPQIKITTILHVGQQIVVAKAAAAPAASTAAATTKTDVKLYQGLGQTIAFRNGPGVDSEGVPVYTFTIVMADATFDAQGKILNAYLDAYEVSTPNYDGASMPHFSGWPGIEGYNVTDHATEKVTGKSTNTLESATAEVQGWQTKRQRGDSYNMNPKNEWYKQMNYYQKFFVGKTVDELEAWFAKNTTSAGRPIKSTTTNADDLKKLAAMTDAEKAELADVVSGATMSLRDPHGDFLGALKNAYANRVEVTVPVK